MDFHPLVIHYPIALLTIYVAFEVIRFQKFTGLPSYSHIKKTFLYLGEISAIVTMVLAILPTSDLAGGGRLTEMYRLFMLITVLVFGLISIIYLREWHSMLRKFAIIPAALIGLFFIVVAGGLFAATVYGTHYDPYLAPIFKFLDVL